MKRYAQGSGALALLASTCMVAALATAPAAMAAPACTHFAAPGGSAGHPYTSVQQLVNSLGAGDVGCLAPGATFNETVSVLNRPGTADKPFIVRSEDPTRPATISAASDAQTEAVVYIGTTASHFELQGVNVHAIPHLGTPAITIAGDSNAVSGADITNEGNGTCVQIGPSPDRRAADARLEGVAIHGCGNPSGDATAKHADGVGITHADRTHVMHSYIYANPRFGITLAPDAQGSMIDHNVIDRQHNGMGDGEGVHFGGDGSLASSNNLVTANVISDNENHNIGYFWNDGSGPFGTGNVVRGNCISNSGNTNGQFQTSPQPTGYTEEQNTVGSDPQYVNRDAPPAGYALTAATPCPGLGPLAAAATLPVTLPPPDPEAEHVFSASVKGEINPHLQPASFHFELGKPGGALAPLAAQSVGPFGMPVEQSSAIVTGLKPSTTYSYRIVPDTPVGSVAGQPLTFTTAEAPRLAPPIPTIPAAYEVRKGRVILSGLDVKDLRGAAVSFHCSPKSKCRFGDRTGRAALDFIRKLRLPLGVRIDIEVDQPTPIGRYRGRTTTLNVVRRKGKVEVKRSDSCVLTDGSLTPCLRPVVADDQGRGYTLVRTFNAIGVAAGTTVDFKCVRGKCPPRPPCRIATRRIAKLPLLRKRQKVKAGVVFEVRFLKPDTQGLVSRFTVSGKSGKFVDTKLRNSFAPASVQHAGQCRDA